MTKTTTICVDVMGGDEKPEVVLEGIRLALEERDDIHILASGGEEYILPFAEKYKDRVTPLISTEVIEMGDDPAMSIRRKPNSSIVLAMKALKEDRADGFFSAGSTGAILAGATLKLGRIKGVKRPALCFSIPLKVPLVFLDMGANAEVRPEMLVQFAQMGREYAKIMNGLESPRVALLNIGAEPTKGTTTLQEAYSRLENEVPEFVGNIEGTDIFSGKTDVLVSDGYAGNIMLKTLEGFAKFLTDYLKDAAKSSPQGLIGGLLLKSKLKGLKDFFDADQIGGVQLLGVKKVVLIGHGKTSSSAVKNGIFAADSAVRFNLTERIAKSIKTSL